MPEEIIQRADQYLADKFNQGVLIPEKTAALNANQGIYDHALTTMYAEKYSTSFDDFNKFKAAYQSQYGDPFKKKASSPTPGVQTFQPEKEDRSTTTLVKSMSETVVQTPEEPSENFVTPSKGTQVATFQTGGDRRQIPRAVASFIKRTIKATRSGCIAFRDVFKRTFNDSY